MIWNPFKKLEAPAVKAEDKEAPAVRERKAEDKEEEKKPAPKLEVVQAEPKEATWAEELKGYEAKKKELLTLLAEKTTSTTTLWNDCSKRFQSLLAKERGTKKWDDKSPYKLLWKQSLWQCENLRASITRYDELMAKIPGLGRAKEEYASKEAELRSELDAIDGKLNMSREERLADKTFNFDDLNKARSAKVKELVALRNEKAATLETLEGEKEALLEQLSSLASGYEEGQEQMALLELQKQEDLLNEDLQRAKEAGVDVTKQKKIGATKEQIMLLVTAKEKVMKVSEAEAKLEAVKANLKASKRNLLDKLVGWFKKPAELKTAEVELKRLNDEASRAIDTAYSAGSFASGFNFNSPGQVAIAKMQANHEAFSARMANVGRGTLTGF